MANGKAKGNKFERVMCKAISLWWTQTWTGNPRDDIFWRTASSGGRATNRTKRGQATKNQHGDVCATDPMGQPLIDMFSIELKSGYDKYTPFDSFDKLPRAGPTVFEKWVSQAKASMQGACSISWLIIFRRTGKIPMVALPAYTAQAIGLRDAYPRVHMKGEDGVGIAVFSLDLFTTTVAPQTIMKLTGSEQCSTPSPSRTSSSSPRKRSSSTRK